jgi:hemerythrin-like domain-containing protein
LKGDDMGPTETLRREHDIVLLILDAAEREGESIRRTGTVHVANAEEMVDFFTNFVERCHHGKEERHLFPALQERGLPGGGGPVAVMLHEHEQGRAAARTLRDALARFSSGEQSTAGDLADALLHYASYLRSHIFKENNVLFPMADQVLSDSDREELARAFERVESEQMGEGVHGKYNELARRLSRH